jgi:SAM-dependent methyltransferase
MLPIRALATACAASVFCLNLAFAQQAAAPVQSAPAQAAPAYEPQSGQAGKDVVWVPTQQALVDRMLDIVGLTAQDYHIDLGSGDGRTVITAARRGARSLGIEYNGDLVALSRRAAEKEGVADKAKFVQADIFESDFSDATVLTLFLLPELNMRLRPTILNMKPGTRVVSNSFTMEDWTPDETIDAGGGCVNFCRAHRWVVPARVEGVWRLPDGELTLKQSFQMLSGSLTVGGKALPITEAKMTGAEIGFTAGDRRFTGRVDGARIEGRSAAGGSEQPWSATRAGS